MTSCWQSRIFPAAGQKFKDEVAAEVEHLKDADKAEAEEETGEATGRANEGDEGVLFIVLDAAGKNRRLETLLNMRVLIASSGKYNEPMEI